MCPLEPATINGAPGSVTPLRSRAGCPEEAFIRRRARYQTMGTRARKCMSLAIKAPPVAVRRPLTAQLLLPMPMSGEIGAKEADAGAAAARISNMSGAGIVAVPYPRTLPTEPLFTTPAAAFGASTSDRAGYRNCIAHFQPASQSG